MRLVAQKKNDRGRDKMINKGLTIVIFAVVTFGFVFGFFN